MNDRPPHDEWSPRFRNWLALLLLIFSLMPYSSQAEETETQQPVIRKGVIGIKLRERVWTDCSLTTSTIFLLNSISGYSIKTMNVKR